MIREISINNISPFSHKIEYILDNKVIGYLEYSLIYDRMEIDNVFVLENYRNQGIASKMLEYIINIYERNQLINITLEVRTSNYRAINLYKKYGFKEVSIRKYYYGDEDGILMEKR